MIFKSPVPPLDLEVIPNLLKPFHPFHLTSHSDGFKDSLMALWNSEIQGAVCWGLK